MPSRDEWAARPLAERKIAAQAWCDGWNHAKGFAGADVIKIDTDYGIVDRFALDLPDAPAQEAGK